VQAAAALLAAAPLLLAALAGGVALAEELAPAGDPDALAAALALPADEAALVVRAARPLDRLVAATVEQPLAAPPPDAVRALARAGFSASDFLVRGLSEGIVAVRLDRDRRRWDGQVLVFAGRVTVLLADEALASPESTSLAGAGGGDGPPGAAAAGSAPAFDLFGFYEQLDAIEEPSRKSSFCQEILATLPAGPDRAVVDGTCARLGRPPPSAVGPGESELALLGGADDEAEQLSAALEGRRPRARRAGDPEHRLLYRTDGVARRAAPGTLPRLLVIGGASAGAAAAVASAFRQERAAEQSFLAYVEAERFGDDRAATGALFETRRHDRLRDASIGAVIAFVAADLVAVAVQAAEQKRFERARARAGKGRGASR
jgi:hypothetical protein